jgi:excisionase family DNA binding protein
MAAKETFTAPQVAERLGVGHDKVLLWIKRGELQAANLATTLDGRPRYGVSQTDLARFLTNRAVVPAAPVVRRRRKQTDTKEFF